VVPVLRRELDALRPPGVADGPTHAGRLAARRAADGLASAAPGAPGAGVSDSAGVSDGDERAETLVRR
jgi:hypothetical protein